MMKKAKRKRNGNASDVGKVAELVCEIQDALGSALSFGRALELMGLGLRSLDDTDYSRAFVTVAETIMRHLDEAKTLCAEVLAESGRP
jgi:hypothetical protein